MKEIILVVLLIIFGLGLQFYFAGGLTPENTNCINVYKNLTHYFTYETAPKD